MRFETIDDPAQFLERAAPLLKDEARHNLMLGIAGTLLRSPDLYPDFGLYLVSSDDGPQAAALMTRPHYLVVADAIDGPAVEALVDGLVAADVSYPGVVGNRPTIDQLVVLMEERAALRSRLAMAQGVFAIENVDCTGVDVPGEARIAGSEDLKLVVSWMGDFLAEALPEEPTEEDQIRDGATRTLAGTRPAAYWLWTREGQPVSMSRYGSPTGRGIRITSVYTPPEHRGNGYATALVAEQSSWLLANDYDFCFLYTDLANATSNAIYERIGYRKVAESANYLVD